MLLPLELKAGLLLAALAAAAFGWHRVAEGYRDEGRQECRSAAAAEFKENTDELSRIASRARTEAVAGAVSGERLRASADRLRGAVAGSGLVIRSAAAAGSAPEPVSETERLSAQLLGGCEATARFADCLASGGEACEQSYDAVSAPK